MSLAFTWIEENQLAASACPIHSELPLLYDRGIRAIVTLTEVPLTIQTNTTYQRLLDIGFEMLHAPIVDMQAPNAELARYVATYIDRMRGEGKPVLLHCLGGVGRTGTILHAYYVLKGLSLDDAKAKIKAVRPISMFSELTNSQRDFLVGLARETE